MATIYTREKRKQQIMILIFLVVVLSIILVWWGGFLGGIDFGIKTAPITPVPPPRDIKINFNVLEGEFLQRARPFEIIEPIDAFGRDNPFIGL